MEHPYDGAMKRMPKLGGQLGFGCIGLGLLVIVFAWNGAAGLDFVQGQIPYLLSGGAIGTGLIVTGAALLVIENARQDRAKLERQLGDLAAAVDRLAVAAATGSVVAAVTPGVGIGSPDDVVVAMATFHRADCRLVAAKDLPIQPLAAAIASGIAPCRICRPTVQAVSSSA